MGHGRRRAPYRRSWPWGGVRASMNCCGGQDACKLDRSGIPRYFGGQTNNCPNGFTGEAGCCIASGDVCQFRDQYCNNQMCLPGDGGLNRCQTISCTPLGGACTTDAGCCAGSSCIENVCRPPAVDAGTPVVDAGVRCLTNGGSCMFSVQCCSQICRVGSCATNSDCCAGTSCTVAAGQLTGTCQSSSCIQQGQTCTAGGNSCCAGLGCFDSNFFPCSGTGACSCRLGIQ
jgi:hypothetical protein